MSSIVVVAAHPDDEVLGCGGTIARLSKNGNEVHVLLLADGETSREQQANSNQLIEQRFSAAQKACDILGCASLKRFTLPDNRLDSLQLLDIVKIIEEFIRMHQPHTVFTHHSGDVNIDHRIVHDAVIAVCRQLPLSALRELLFFQVPSSTEWRPPCSLAPFSPNWFVDISSTLSVKLEALKAYQDEIREFPHPRSFQAVSALAQWQGATAGVQAAEAFMLGRKLL